MTQTHPDTEVIFDPRTYAGRSLKRRHTGEDVISILLQAEDEGGKITTVEFENMFFLFAVAGNDQLVLKRLPVRWKKAARPRAS